MAILAIESALDIAIKFGDTELVKIYQEAWQKPVLNTSAPQNAGLNKKGCLL